MEIDQYKKKLENLVKDPRFAIGLAAAILSIIVLVLISVAVKNIMAKSTTKKYNLISYNPGFESIYDGQEVENLDHSQKYLFINQDENDQIRNKFLNLIDEKIRQNKQTNSKEQNLASVETNCLLAGPPGNGKTSFVRAVASHIHCQSKTDVLIMNINTRFLSSVDGFWIFKNTPEQKLRNAINKARQIAGKNKYVIINIEEMDQIVEDPSISKIILDELSNTDSTVNHHIAFIGTTNDPKKIYDIRQRQEKQDRDAKEKERNGIFGGFMRGMQNLVEQDRDLDNAGNTRDGKDRNDTDPKTERDKAGSILRRLPVLQIKNPNRTTIKTMLEFAVKQCNNRSDLIEKLLPVLDGSSAHCISNMIVSINAMIDSQTKTDQIIDRITKTLQDDQKQTGFELTKSLTRQRLAKVFHACEAFNDVDRHCLKIDELEDCFKDHNSLEALKSNFQNKRKKYAEDRSNLERQREKIQLEIDYLKQQNCYHEDGLIPKMQIVLQRQQDKCIQNHINNILSGTKGAEGSEETTNAINRLRNDMAKQKEKYNTQARELNTLDSRVTNLIQKEYTTENMLQITEEIVELSAEEMKAQTQIQPESANEAATLSRYN
jgi:hypothetical protein